MRAIWGKKKSIKSRHCSLKEKEPDLTSLGKEALLGLFPSAKKWAKSRRESGYTRGKWADQGERAQSKVLLGHHQKLFLNSLKKEAW